jgi:hypothetical protein
MNTLVAVDVGRGSVNSAGLLFLRHHYCSRYCTPSGSSWVFVTSISGCELLALQVTQENSAEGQLRIPSGSSWAFVTSISGCELLALQVTQKNSVEGRTYQ